MQIYTNFLEENGQNAVVAGGHRRKSKIKHKKYRAKIKNVKNITGNFDVVKRMAIGKIEGDKKLKLNMMSPEFAFVNESNQ